MPPTLSLLGTVGIRLGDVLDSLCPLGRLSLWSCLLGPTFSDALYDFGQIPSSLCIIFFYDAKDPTQGFMPAKQSLTTELLSLSLSLVLETRSSCVAQAGFNLLAPLAWLPEFWNYRPVLCYSFDGVCVWACMCVFVYLLLSL